METVIRDLYPCGRVGHPGRACPHHGPGPCPDRALGPGPCLCPGLGPFALLPLLQKITTSLKVTRALAR